MPISVIHAILLSDADLECEIVSQNLTLSGSALQAVLHVIAHIEGEAEQKIALFKALDEQGLINYNL